jgi:hypothetical protein
MCMIEVVAWWVLVSKFTQISKTKVLKWIEITFN